MSSIEHLPYLLQTSEGKVSMPAIACLLTIAMILAVFITIAVYIFIVRKFHSHFEVKERVTGQHMSFLEAVGSERRRRSTTTNTKKNSTTTSSSSSMISNHQQQQQEQNLFDEDFENVSGVVAPEEINTPTQKTKIVPNNVFEKNSYLTSAREVTV